MIGACEGKIRVGEPLYRLDRRTASGSKACLLCKEGIAAGQDVFNLRMSLNPLGLGLIKIPKNEEIHIACGQEMAQAILSRKKVDGAYKLSLRKSKGKDCLLCEQPVPKGDLVFSLKIGISVVIEIEKDEEIDETCGERFASEVQACARGSA